MEKANREVGEMPFPTLPTVAPPAPLLLMTAFWMLLGGAAGIRVAQSIGSFAVGASGAWPLRFR